MRVFFSALNIFLLAALLPGPAGALAAGPAVAVIINKTNPVASLSDGSLKKIYTGKILRWPNGRPITIYDLPVDDPLREKFSLRILGRSPRRVAETWAHLKITNQARNAPRTVKSQLYVTRKVSTERGAIGYVRLEAVKDNPHVKIIKIIR